jgi:hypothetical protein
VTEPTALTPGLIAEVPYGGIPVLVANSEMGDNGGKIINPLTNIDQNIAVAEPLYVNIVHSNPLIDQYNNELMPGQTFICPPNVNVWVNASSSGHKFVALFSSAYLVPYPPALVPGQPGSEEAAPGGTGVFPPDGVTGLTEVIPSYLYQEYSDDDDLQGFVQAQNDMQQDFVDTFNFLELPIYPGPIVSGKLLDWVGNGLYGFPRPSLGTGRPEFIGPLNTWAPNWKPYPLPPVVTVSALNMIENLIDWDVHLTNDDFYRRILTWHFYKGDGKYISVRWIKRRVWRFCYGENGWAPNSVGIDYWPYGNDLSIADTDQISVSFGANRNISIRFVLNNTIQTGGEVLNEFGCNGFGPAIHNLYPPSEPWRNAVMPLNDLEALMYPLPPLPYMLEFQEAVNIGAVELPYQFNYTVVIG